MVAKEVAVLKNYWSYFLQPTPNIDTKLTKIRKITK